MTLLKSSKTIMFKQKVELLEAMSGCETANTYKIYDVADNGK